MLASPETGSIDPYTAECLNALQAEACMVSTYPQVVRASDLNPHIEETFDLVEKVIYTIRNIRGEMKLPPGVSTDVHIIGTTTDPHFSIIGDHRHIISALVKTNVIEMHQAEPILGFASTGVLNALKIAIPLPKELLQQEHTRLSKEKERLEISIQKTRTQLSNNEFVNNAPTQLVEKLKNQFEQSEREIQEVSLKLEKMKGESGANLH